MPALARTDVINKLNRGQPLMYAALVASGTAVVLGMVPHKVSDVWFKLGQSGHSDPARDDQGSSPDLRLINAGTIELPATGPVFAAPAPVEPSVQAPAGPEALSPDSPALRPQLHAAFAITAPRAQAELYPFWSAKLTEGRVTSKPARPVTAATVRKPSSATRNAADQLAVAAPGPRTDWSACDGIGVSLRALRDRVSCGSRPGTSRSGIFRRAGDTHSQREPCRSPGPRDRRPLGGRDRTSSALALASTPGAVSTSGQRRQCHFRWPTCADGTGHIEQPSVERCRFMWRRERTVRAAGRQSGSADCDQHRALRSGAYRRAGAHGRSLEHVAYGWCAGPRQIQPEPGRWARRRGSFGLLSKKLHVHA